MDADPRTALRRQQDSSMWQALSLVQSGGADACVSAGNTGALMAMSKYLLKTFPGIDRPAICKSMPVALGRSYMLDLGANLSCTPEQLHQFALMGSVLAASAGAGAKPRVALLNVGVESGKGTRTIQAADALISADERLNYAGFIEANAIYRGDVEVIVCDGFAGNVALKASEGVAQLIAQKVTASFSRHWYYRLLSLSLRPLLRNLQRELNPDSYNGACFLGLRHVVVKSHGGADANGFGQALMVAQEQVQQDVPGRTGRQLAADE
jgi:glycerol-3-phosphate acyltransferase PlsX